MRLLAQWQRAWSDERHDRLREVWNLRKQLFRLEHRAAAAENDVEILRLQLKQLGARPAIDQEEELARAA